VSTLVQLGSPSSLSRVGTEVRSPDGVEKIMLAAVGLGCAGLLFAMFAPGSAAARGWIGIFWFALICTGGAGYFWLAYKGTTAGIKNHGVFHSDTSNRGVIGWTLGVAFTAFYVALYWHGESLQRAFVLLDPLSDLLRTPDPTSSAAQFEEICPCGTLGNQIRVKADQWFLYGTLYTAAVGVLGVRMAMKYRHNRYQLVRTSSVFFFQLGFAFLIPNVLKAMNQPEFYFTYFWPLKPEYLLPFSQGWTIDGGR